MRPIRPIGTANPHRLHGPRPVQQIHFPHPIDELGHDPLITPPPVTPASVGAAFAIAPSEMESGVFVDVVNGIR